MTSSRTQAWIMAAALGAALAVVPTAEAATNEIVEPPRRMEQMLPVKHIRFQNGVVSGEVVNSTGDPVCDVRLDIDYEWLWKHEFRPGTDRFSRLSHYTVPGEIRPGEHRAFSFRPDSPLTKRHDGRYMALVHVARAVDVRG